VKWLREIVWPTELEKLRLEIMLEELGELRKKIVRVTKVLNDIGRKHAGVRLLMTIPSVGPRTAEAFMAYVDDPHRFTNSTIGSYFGLVPREDSTGDHRRLGHITREGPSTVRKYLTEAMWRGVSKDEDLKRVYERFLRGDKTRKKIAMVAMSHWLCRVMLAMLKSGEAFRDTTDGRSSDDSGEGVIEDTTRKVSKKRHMTN
jgi:transposase